MAKTCTLDNEASRQGTVGIPMFDVLIWYDRAQVVLSLIVVFFNGECTVEYKK